MNVPFSKNVISREKRSLLIVDELSQIFMKITYKGESGRIWLILSLHDDNSNDYKYLNPDNLSKLASIYESYVSIACNDIDPKKVDELFTGQRDKIAQQVINFLDVLHSVKNLIHHVRFLDVCTTDKQTGEIVARTILRFSGQSLLIVKQNYSQNLLNDFFLRIHLANVKLIYCILKKRIDNIIRDTSRFIAVIQGILVTITLGYAIFNLYQTFDNDLTLGFITIEIFNFVLPLIIWQLLPFAIKVLLKQIWIPRIVKQYALK
jgi:hypothetical protein